MRYTAKSEGKWDYGVDNVHALEISVEYFSMLAFEKLLKPGNPDYP